MRCEVLEARNKESMIDSQMVSLSLRALESLSLIPTEGGYYYARA
jgi:hypothetical protein